ERLVFSGRDLRALGTDVHRFGPGLYSANFDGSKPRKLISRTANSITFGKEDALSWDHVLLAVPQPQARVETGKVLVGQMTIEGHRLASMKPIWLNTRTGGWT